MLKENENKKDERGGIKLTRFGMDQFKVVEVE